MGLLDTEHRLIFAYDDFIRESWMELRVEPRSSIHQTVHSFYLAVGPPSTVERYVDWNENYVHHFGVADYHERIEVVTRSLVDAHPQHLSLAELTEPPTPVAGPLLDFIGFGGPIVRSRALEQLGKSVRVTVTAPLGEQVSALGRALLERVHYLTGVTDYRSNTDHALAEGSGVCQDFAHLLLGLLRLRDIPCRYVSGYLHVDQSGREPSQSHAWVEVYSLKHGWVAFDPTHDQSPDDTYVCVGHGRHYDDTPPNRGIYRGSAQEKLRAEVHTQRSTQRDVVGLHEQVEAIDVPVHRELPAAGRDRRLAVAQGVPQQQQQQQQQTDPRVPG
jgi:transglutaminase-like putative cysteine protease